MHPSGKKIAIDVFVQAILYGLYVATFVHCLRWLIYTDDGWRRRDRVNKLMLTATILIFMLTTMDLGIAFRYVFASIRAENPSPGTGVVGVCELYYWCHLNQIE